MGGELQCLSTLLCLAACFKLTYSNVYTSSKKIEDMVLKEDSILMKLHTDLVNLGDGTAMSHFEPFYTDRMRQVKERLSEKDLPELLKHPNAVYQNIKHFVLDYQGIRSALESTSVKGHLAAIASEDDLTGARRSFLRLQTVYSLNALDMAHGDYLGYKGPPLTTLDAFEIAQTAFGEGKLNSTAAWLEAAHELKLSEGISQPGSPTEGHILGLLGRTLVRLGKDTAAEELYTKAQGLDPTNGDVRELRAELDSHVRQTENREPKLDRNFARLCTIQSKLTTKQFDPRLRCTYRTVFVPYFRFEHELISISPYVALFYNIISDSEGEYIRDFARPRLERGSVELPSGSIRNEGRTSDLSFVWDNESKNIARISQRVGAVTYLNTSQHPSGYPFAGEPFQVVNYGLGGHYGVHMDPFEESSKKNNEATLNDNGNRIATFLIYLSDVEKGGSTAFPSADLAVFPIKNMALFWYSMDPSGKLDKKTLHAGCPVVVGHKWVTNKWIWTNGNIFNRRCGLSENATQFDIDEDMRRTWT